MRRTVLMPFGVSLYLDLFRIVATLTVVAAHVMGDPHFGGDFANLRFGEEAVMGFFALSGLVIAFVAETRERDPAVFAAARLSRLWAALLPALALTPLIDAIGRHFSPAAYEGWGRLLQFDDPLGRLVSTGFFLNEIWFFSITPLSNVPIWSLGFEAWYYALFAACVFSGRALRPFAVGAFALAAGPKILLLIPPWLLGALIYRKRASLRVGGKFALALFLGGPALIVVLKALHVRAFLLEVGNKLLGTRFVEESLGFANAFLWQNLVGALVCAHFIGALSLGGALVRVLAPAERAIRLGSAATLPVYVLHFPFALMTAAMIGAGAGDGVKMSAVLVGALVFPVLVGAIVAPLHAPLRAFLLSAFRASGRKLREAARPTPAPFG